MKEVISRMKDAHNLMYRNSVEENKNRHNNMMNKAKKKDFKRNEREG